MKASKVITFNAAAELLLGSVTLVLASSDTCLVPTETNFDAPTERVSLTFDEELHAGTKATLRLSFESQLTDSMTGYYKSTWAQGIYALTHFEVRALLIQVDVSLKSRCNWPMHLSTVLDCAQNCAQVVNWILFRYRRPYDYSLDFSP